MSYPFLPLIETAFPVDARVTPSRVRPSDVPAAGTGTRRTSGGTHLMGIIEIRGDCQEKRLQQPALYE